MYALVTLSVAIASALIALYPDPGPSHVGKDDEAATSTVKTYAAGRLFQTAPLSGDDVAHCGNSLTSTRSDAVSCIVPIREETQTAALRTAWAIDPCFQVDESSVICADAGKLNGYQRYRSSPRSRSPRVSPLKDFSRTVPWRIILSNGDICDRRLRPLEFPLTGEKVPIIRRPARGSDPIFTCDGRGTYTIATAWTLGKSGELLQATTLGIPLSSGTPIVTGLNQTGKAWTALYSKGQNSVFTTLAVRTAVY